MTVTRLAAPKSRRRAGVIETHDRPDASAVDGSESPRLTPALAHALLTVIAHSEQPVDDASVAIKEDGRNDVIASRP